MRKPITVLTISLVLLGTNLNLLAKPEEIGLGAIVVDTSLKGKGAFKTNDNIVEKDYIITKSEGSTTILFNDESMLTLGPNAEARIAVYDEGDATRPGQSHIQVIKGTFRFFPGDILDNGGAQFIIAGNKAIGASNGKLQPVFLPQNNAGNSPKNILGKSASNNKAIVPVNNPVAVEAGLDVGEPEVVAATDIVDATESERPPFGSVPGVPISLDIEHPDLGNAGPQGSNTAVFYMTKCETCSPPGLITVQPGQVFTNPLSGPQSITLPGIQTIDKDSPLQIGLVFQGTVSIGVKSKPIVDLVVTDADNNIYTRISKSTFIPLAGTLTSKLGKNGELSKPSKSYTGARDIGIKPKVTTKLGRTPSKGFAKPKSPKVNNPTVITKGSIKLKPKPAPIAPTKSGKFVPTRPIAISPINVKPRPVDPVLTKNIRTLEPVIVKPTLTTFEPVVVKPVIEPIAVEPVVLEPVAVEPVVFEPVLVEPVIEPVTTTIIKTFDTRLLTK